jgi:hypothetical protein
MHEIAVLHYVIGDGMWSCMLPRVSLYKVEVQMKRNDSP